MSHAEKDIELVEKYFDEGLTDMEQRAFERRLNTDEGFRALVDQEKYIIGAIRMQGLSDELDQLKRIEKGLKDPHVELQSADNRRWFILAAAVIALIIVARFALMPAVTGNELYEQYYRPYPNVFEPSTRSGSSGQNRSEAFRAYEKGDYHQAALLFKKELETEKDDGMLLLLGNCNLMAGKVDEAIANFNEVMARSNTLTIQAKWYLTMAYLSRNDNMNALPLLRDLAESDASYAAKAKEILKELE